MPMRRSAKGHAGKLPWRFTPAPNPVPGAEQEMEDRASTVKTI